MDVIEFKHELIGIRKRYAEALSRHPKSIALHHSLDQAWIDVLELEYIIATHKSELRLLCDKYLKE